MYKVATVCIFHYLLQRTKINIKILLSSSFFVNEKRREFELKLKWHIFDLFR